MSSSRAAGLTPVGTPSHWQPDLNRYCEGVERSRRGNIRGHELAESIRAISLYSSPSSPRCPERRLGTPVPACWSSTPGACDSTAARARCPWAVLRRCGHRNQSRRRPDYATHANQVASAWPVKAATRTVAVGSVPGCSRLRCKGANRAATQPGRIGRRIRSSPPGRSGQSAIKQVAAEYAGPVNGDWSRPCHPDRSAAYRASAKGNNPPLPHRQPQTTLFLSPDMKRIVFESGTGMIPANCTYPR